MGRFRPRHRSDGNTDTIAKMVRKVPGASIKLVGNLIDEFDAIIGYRGRNYLIELKNPDTSHGVTDSQRKFQAKWNGQYAVIETEADMMALLLEPQNEPKQYRS